MSLNFHFFDTESVYIQKLRLSIKNIGISLLKVQFVSRFNTALVLFRDSLLPRPKYGPGSLTGKESPVLLAGA